MQDSAGQDLAKSPSVGASCNASSAPAAASALQPARVVEVALAALQHLQSGGRQVGIISHVAALHERIPARVLVEPLGEGRSRLRVPR